MESREQKLVLFLAILASFVSFLDGSVINVALPAIARDFQGGLFLQQWVVDAYLITLGSLILIAGSLADVYGQRKMLRYGLYGFAAASLLCAIAPNGESLIAGRALQGMAGALLVPGSLSMIIATFEGEAQGRAIGSWTAWTGISFLIGPLIGGILVDTASWRMIFAINMIPIGIALWLLHRISTPDQRDSARRLDILGACMCAIGLFGVVFALIEEPHLGWQSLAVIVPFAIGIAALITFFVNEKNHADPMLPFELFSVGNFSIGNIATLAIYAGLSIATFLITIFLQEVGGYTALEAGLALIPVTAIMFFFSSRFGALAASYGPRAFMTCGPLLGALGFVLMLRVTLPIDYWSTLLPGIVVFGFGLAITVAPLTAAILGSIDTAHAGIGSAINNAVARIAGLLAIAVLGVWMGPHLDLDSFKKGVILAALLLASGGIISVIGIRNAAPRRS